MEQIKSVLIHTASTTTREYDAIRFVIADLHLSCDLVSDRQIRIAKKLAEQHGATFTVSGEILVNKVNKALCESGDL